MDEDEFKEHVKRLKRKYAKTVREIEKYGIRQSNFGKEVDIEKLEHIDLPVGKFLDLVKKVSLQMDVNHDKEKFNVVKNFGCKILSMQLHNELDIADLQKSASRSKKPDDVLFERINVKLSILESWERNSLEILQKLMKAEMYVHEVEALAEKKVDEVVVPKVEALSVEKVDYADDIDVGECLIKAADLCCQDEKVAVPKCSAVSADVKSSVLSDGKVVKSEVEKSIKDDWKYRRSMWWLNFRRKIIYDKMRSKKPCKTVRKNLKVYDGGIHKFIDEYKDVEGCDIRGWKKRLVITKNDVRNYITKLKSNCKVSS